MFEFEATSHLIAAGEVKAHLGATLNRSLNPEHAKKVDEWISKSVVGLNHADQAQVFASAILALENRILLTLSSITWKAILERALFQSSERYPLLSEIKIETHGISIVGILPNLQSEQTNQLIDSFRFFIIEIITIVGNLTAEVLSEPLYRVLSKIVAEGKVSTDRGDL